MVLTIMASITLIYFVLGVLQIDNVFGNLELTPAHYLGFITLLINYFIYFFAREYYKFIFGTTLLLGLFNFINFTPSKHTISIGVIVFEIPFQPYVFLIGLLTYILNINTVNSFLKASFNLSPKEQEMLEDEAIKKFMEKYKSFSNERLEAIVEDKRYASQAKEASRKILAQRKNTIEGL